MREEIQLGGVSVRFLVEPEASDGSVSVFECAVRAGAKVPVPHSHDAFEETIYGLEGGSTWTVDGAVTRLGPGEALCIRRGAVHGFVNDEEADARFLAIATPGVMAPAYFRDVREVLAHSAGGPPDPERIAAVMRRHGLTPRQEEVPPCPSR